MFLFAEIAECHFVSLFDSRYFHFPDRHPWHLLNNIQMPSNAIVTINLYLNEFSIIVFYSQCAGHERDLSIWVHRVKSSCPPTPGLYAQMRNLHLLFEHKLELLIHPPTHLNYNWISLFTLKPCTNSITTHVIKYSHTIIHGYWRPSPEQSTLYCHEWLNSKYLIPT